VHTKTLEGGEAFKLRYQGSYDDLDESYVKIFRFAHSKGVQPGMEFLEVYRSGLPGSDNDEIELIMIIHPWIKHLISSVNNVIGDDDAIGLVKGLSDIGPMTDLEERFYKIKYFLEDLELTLTLKKETRYFPDVPTYSQRTGYPR